jgi:hypothetical protein
MTNPLLDAPLKAPPPPSELDELMSRDPLKLSSQDIDAIIQYQRAQRARRESGKGKKPALSDGAGIDLAAMMRGEAIPKVVAPVAPTSTAKPSGFRRI